jgi:hypothetical protein
VEQEASQLTESFGGLDAFADEFWVIEHGF